MNDIEKYEAIEKVIDESIRPYLQGDGGDIELDLVKGNEVVISFQGACGSCPSSASGTLRGIERSLRQQVDPDGRHPQPQDALPMEGLPRLAEPGRVPAAAARPLAPGKILTEIQDDFRRFVDEIWRF